MAKVELRGYSDLRRALKRFAPDLEKQLKTELAAALKPVVTQARGFVPANSDIMRGWQPRSFSEARFPFYNASTIKKGIVYKTTPSKPNANGFTSMARIINQSAAGAIYETAGLIGPQPWVGPKAGGSSKKVSRSNWQGAGAQFISNLEPLTSSLKGQGRLIFKAWSKNRGAAEGAAMRAISKATVEFERRAKGNKLRSAA